MGVLYHIYDDLIESYRNISRLQIERNILEYTAAHRKELREHLGGGSAYFPNEIKIYIIKNVKKRVEYKMLVSKKEITIRFYVFKNTSDLLLNKYFIIAGVIFYMINLHASSGCSKKLEIDIYLTDFKRLVPAIKKDILGQINVNGGYSNIGCLDSSSIVIYRKEDWLKVLIHELFHNLDMDFSTLNIDKLREKARKNFEITSEYNIYEVYCEIWARILYIALLVFINMDIHKKSYRIFANKFSGLIKQEIDFSLYQSNKILSRCSAPSLYKENSNIFCYYILTAALLFNFPTFLSWCHKNNVNILKFKKNKNNMESFLNLIIKEFKNPDFQKRLNNPKKFINHSSLKMVYHNFN